MGFGVADQGRDVVVGEEGVGENFGRGETGGMPRGWVVLE